MAAPNKLPEKNAKELYPLHPGFLDFPSDITAFLHS